MDRPFRELPVLTKDMLVQHFDELVTDRRIRLADIEAQLASHRLAHILGIAIPNVAILSAIETVNPRIRSSVEAVAICKMADRGQISGVVDGPLAFDTAVSETAATTQGISSPVAGKTDILVAPDLETGTLLAKQLEYLAEAQAAGIVFGARVPIALIR